MFKSLPDDIQEALLKLAKFSSDYYATTVTKEDDEYTLTTDSAYKVTFILEITK